MTRKRPHVGLIGLGIIGTRVATALRGAGFPVAVWNRTPLPAPNFLGSPAEVARESRILQLFVADARAVFEVIEAFSDALTPEHIVICSATIGPEATRKAAEMVQSRGARFLDAPFTGSKVAAEKRQLVYYVGGDEATFLRAKPVLEASSKAVIPLGRIGDASIVKVVTNLIAAVSIQTLGEALAILSKSGLDAEVLSAALAENACRSGTMDLKLPKMVHADYEPHFSLKHMFKDVKIAVEMAKELELEVPTATLTADLMGSGLVHGWGELDFSSLFKLYDAQLAGLIPPARPDAPTAGEAKPILPEPAPTLPPAGDAAATEQPATSEAGTSKPQPDSKVSWVKKFFRKS